MNENDSALRKDPYVMRGRLWLAALCVAGGIARCFAPEKVDSQALLFLLAAGVLLMLPYVLKIKGGKGGFEVEFDKAADKETMEKNGVGGIKPHTDDGVVSLQADSGADDPQKGKWGGKEIAAGYRIAGCVQSIENSPDWFRIILAVDKVETDAREGKQVRFYLHPTFKRTVVAKPIQNGRALFNLVAWGAFTVGAEVLDAGGNLITKLELDLSTVTGAPEAFRLR
jgi:hypothetical protein